MSAAGRDPNDLKEWCGTGWTGQPNVVPTERGLEVREGAYDGAYHFVDVGSGAALLPPQGGEELLRGGPVLRLRGLERFLLRSGRDRGGGPSRDGGSRRCAEARAALATAWRAGRW